jgi:hypothetical protein
MAFPLAGIIGATAGLAGLLKNKDRKKSPSFGDFEDPRTGQLRQGTFEDVSSRIGTFRPYTGSLTPSTAPLLGTSEGILLNRLIGDQGFQSGSIGGQAEQAVSQRLQSPFQASQVVDAPGAQQLFDLRRQSLRTGYEDIENELMEQLVGLGLSRSPSGLGIVQKGRENRVLQEQLLAEEIANEQLNRFANALQLQEQTRQGDISQGFQAQGLQEDILGRDLGLAMDLGGFQTGVEERGIERGVADFARQFDELRLNLADALAVQGELTAKQKLDFASRLQQIQEAEAARKANSAAFGQLLGASLPGVLNSIPAVASGSLGTLGTIGAPTTTTVSPGGTPGGTPGAGGGDFSSIINSLSPQMIEEIVASGGGFA